MCFWCKSIIKWKIGEKKEEVENRKLQYKKNTNSLLKIPEKYTETHRQKYYSLNIVWMNLVLFWKTAKVSLLLSVWVVLFFEVIKSKHTHHLQKKPKILCFACFILFYYFLDVLPCPCLMLVPWLVQLSFHIIIMWMALSYAALHSDFREILIQVRR